MESRIVLEKVLNIDLVTEIVCDRRGRDHGSARRVAKAGHAELTPFRI